MKISTPPAAKIVRGLLFAMAMLAPLPTLAQTQPQAQSPAQPQTAQPQATQPSAPAQSPDAELDQKLAKYDPVAVNAAKHYAQVFNMKSVLAQSMPAVRDAIIQMVKAKNPQLDDASIADFVQTALKTMYMDQAPFYEKFTIVTMLDVYTTEEIVAIDQFYSSPIGQSMLKKAPQVMAKMPEMFEIMQKQIFPMALQEAQKALKAKGKDIAL
jgi:hypothetical protein